MCAGALTVVVVLTQAVYGHAALAGSLETATRPRPIRAVMTIADRIFFMLGVSRFEVDGLATSRT